MQRLLYSLLFLSGTTYAVEPPSIPSQIDRVLQQEQQRQEAQTKEAPTDVFFDRPTKDDITISDDDGRCFQINKIDIQGVKLLSERKKEQLLKPFIGKCLSIGDLNNIIKVISNYYLDKGYVTSRAFIGPQDINDKQLDILIIEGKVGKIKMSTKNPRFEGKTAFPGLEGRPLNLRDIEMGIERINRLASNEAKSSLIPGQEHGLTDVEVVNEPTRPWHFNLRYDNHGSDATGDKQISGGLIWDNPLGINDRFTLNLNGTQKRNYNQGTRGNSISYQVPYGYWLFDLGYSKFNYRQTIVGLNQTFRSTGKSSTYKLGLEYLFHRNQDSKSKVSFTLTRKNNRNYIEDVLIGISSRKLTIGTLALNHYRLFKNGKLDVTLTGHRGLKWFGAKKDQGDDSPKAQFTKYTLDIFLLKQFNAWDKAASFYTSLHVQESNDNLYGTEHLSIGSLYTVRGFKELNLSGNSGWYLRNELSINFPLTGPVSKALSTVSPYIAYDIGEIKSDSFIQGGQLSGGTVGLRLFGKYVSVDVSWSKPLEKPRGFTDESVFLASLRLNF